MELIATCSAQPHAAAVWHVLALLSHPAACAPECRSHRTSIDGRLGMQEERQSFKEKLTGSGLVDVWRQQYPDKVLGLRPSYVADF